ncbi:hypothetical protein O9992_18115 [Vibrio lentus]|nr:hypothetical protein [Vibrio lentus]
MAIIRPNPKADNRRYANAFRMRIHQDNYLVADVYNYVDFPSSVSTMFTDKSGLQPDFYGVSGTNLFNAHGSSNSSQFNIRLSNKLSDLDPINSMWADGGTAAFKVF